MKTRPENELRLSERQQLLLSRYFDGECGCIDRFLAKRLLTRNEEAYVFFNDMEAVRGCCTKSLGVHHSHTISSAELWERISVRIDQETRAELYLGKRRLDQTKESVWTRLLSPYTLAGGLSGAALAGALLFVMYRPTSIVSFTAPQLALSTPGNFIQPVALGGGAQSFTGSRPLRQAPLEVDWLRSQGSLQLIPDPDGHSAIIWVRRKREQLQKPTVRDVRQRALTAASPIVTIPAIPSVPARQWLDGSSQTGAK